MSKVWVGTRQKVYFRDHWSCVYCGKQCIDHLDVAAGFGDRTQMLTVDHVIPTAMGGSNRFENLVTACLPCNVRKNKRTAEQYAEYMAARK